MHRVLTIVLSATVTLGLAACGHAPDDSIPSQAASQLGTASPGKPGPAAGKTMRAFRSEAELATYLRRLAERQRQESRHTSLFASLDILSKAAPPQPPAAAGVSMNSEESVTNVQHAGVDEGSIVKVHGGHLVILRRGRLFTVAIGAGELQPISSVDAYGPDVDPRNTWYDEILVSNDTVVVIGYSYARGGTEVGLFSIDAAGNLAYRSTYQLRSNDYYSSRNYASRLIGNKLIFYSPLSLYPGMADPFSGFPAVRKWHKDADSREFQRIAPADQVYLPQFPIDDVNSVTLHTVTICDLASRAFACKATSVIGPRGRLFYVSPKSVYIWVTDGKQPKPKTETPSMVYRMPLDGSSPTALRVSGSPVDQFSFLESDDGYLNVLVRSEGRGDGMWNAEGVSGAMALMRVPLSSFSDGSEMVAPSSYRRLPNVDGLALQNRFVGDYLLYGTGSGWGAPEKAERSHLYALRWSDSELHTLTLPHGVDRIEQMGSDAVVVGTDGQDLHFTALRLGNSPEVAGDYVRQGASQGELRSHGFFYKPEAANSGMLGLPIATPVRPGFYHLFENSAAILFLRNDSLHLEEVGELAAHPDSAKDDACQASCVDWYGNAQPLFVHGRIFALLGYELVEGSVDSGRIGEVRRVNYAQRVLARK